MLIRYDVLRSTGTKLVAPASGSACLWTANINTGATNAVLKIYDGVSTAGTLVATIDASTKSSHAFGVTCNNGIFLDLSGGNADCTVGYA